MPTFKEAYCETHRCAPDDFIREVFCAAFCRRSLLPPALCFKLQSRLFNPEREWIDALGKVSTMRQFDEEVQYFLNRRVLGWWRRKIGLRLSSRELRSLAVSCLDPMAANARSRSMEPESSAPKRVPRTATRARHA